MTLIQEIEKTRKDIWKLTQEIYSLGETQAAKYIVNDIYVERKALYLKLGQLVCNSAVKVCLR